MNGLVSTRTRRDDRGPHAGILAIVSTALFLAGLIASTVLAGGQAFLSPYAPASELQSYFSSNALAIRVNGTFLFASSVPLGIYAATVYARLLHLGVRVPGPGIGYFGGISASIMLALSGLLTWTLGQPGVAAQPAVLHALDFLAFATGGIGFVGGLGLLIAGLAVPALFLRLMPRWFVWVGLIVAALSEISFLAMFFAPLNALLPIGRFIGLAWLIVAGFLLPHSRHDVAGPRR